MKLSLRPVGPGLVMALITALFGFGLGMAFGVAEDDIKQSLAESARAVGDAVYAGDEAKMKAMAEKAWVNCKRAHMHASALGTHALGVGLLLALLGRARAGWRAAAAIMVGAGGLGYGLFWLLAAFRVPALGSSDAAKESLRWLAMPSSGAVVVGTGIALALLSGELLRGRGDAEG